MIETSRSILNRYIPDIYLYSDVYKGNESGKYGPCHFTLCFVDSILGLPGML